MSDDIGELRKQVGVLTAQVGAAMAEAQAARAEAVSVRQILDGTLQYVGLMTTQQGAIRRNLTKRDDARLREAAELAARHSGRDQQPQPYLRVCGD